MGDISAREPKGHNFLAVERFRDNTRWMIKCAACQPPLRQPRRRDAAVSHRGWVSQAVLLGHQNQAVRLRD